MKLLIIAASILLSSGNALASAETFGSAPHFVSFRKNVTYCAAIEAAETLAYYYSLEGVSPKMAYNSIPKAAYKWGLTRHQAKATIKYFYFHASHPMSPALLGIVVHDLYSQCTYQAARGNY